MILYFCRTKRYFTFYMPRYSDSFAEGFNNYSRLFFSFFSVKLCVGSRVLPALVITLSLTPCYLAPKKMHIFFPFIKMECTLQSYVYTGFSVFDFLASFTLQLLNRRCPLNEGHLRTEEMAC